MITIVLYEPEIPPNTGNIIRLVANSGANLALIEPLGFELSDTKLKRAGLDYHELAKVRIYSNLDDYLKTINLDRVFAFSTKGTQFHSNVKFKKGDTLIFGPETRGLPDTILERFRTTLLRIPMHPKSRSLNLANAVSIGLYEAWRQIGYPDAC